MPGPPARALILSGDPTTLPGLVHLLDAGGGVDPVLQEQRDLGPGLQQAQRQAGHQHRHL